MLNLPCPVGAVLFDFFGTLTIAVRRGPNQRRIAELLHCDPDRWFALLDRTFYYRAAGKLGDPIAVLRKLAASLGARPPQWALYEAYAARIAAVRADAPLRDDAVAVLRAIRGRNLRTAVVSDCWYELPLILPTLPVARHVDATVYSGEVGECKPHPQMYLTACRRLGVRPSECLYVGDGGSHELTGAEQVGIPAMRLAAPDLRQHLSFGSDAGWRGPALTSLSEVPELLDRAPALV